MARIQRPWIAVLTFSSFLCLPAAFLRAAERPDFTGIWQLNEELSENPRDKMAEGRGGRGGGKGGGRGGGGWGGGGGGGGGRGGGGMGGGRPGGPGGDREAMRQRMQSLQEGIRRLQITHQDPELIIVYADDRERTLFTDGREIVNEMERGIFEASANWKSNKKMVFHGETTSGGKLTETYELSEDGQQLYITTKIESSGRMPKINFRRVYDPAEPEDADSVEKGSS